MILTLQHGKTRYGSRALALVFIGLVISYGARATADAGDTQANATIVPASTTVETEQKTELMEATLIVVGGAAGQTESPTLGRLKQRLVTADSESTIVIFTGNYSSAGEMPGKSHKQRAKVEQDAKAHVDTVRDFVRRGGRVFFLSGHSDYGNRGRKSVRRLRKFINAEFNKAFDDDDHHVDVMPNAACGEPTVLELGEFGVLALVNSQWWMQNWKAHARSNEGL